MPKYIIERDVPGAGEMSADDMQKAVIRSCEVLRNMGTDIQWVQSYVADDKFYCVYIAASEQLVREHARESGFPADRVSIVRKIVDPAAAEAIT